MTSPYIGVYIIAQKNVVSLLSTEDADSSTIMSIANLSVVDEA